MKKVRRGGVPVGGRRSNILAAVTPAPSRVEGPIPSTRRQRTDTLDNRSLVRFPLLWHSPLGALVPLWPEAKQSSRPVQRGLNMPGSLGGQGKGRGLAARSTRAVRRPPRPSAGNEKAQAKEPAYLLANRQAFYPRRQRWGDGRGE